MFGRRSLSAKALSAFALAAATIAVAPVFADNLNVNGANRTMNVYAPKNIEKGRPLIIQMHGMNQDAPYQQNAAKWESIADTARFVVVFPNGENKAWDIGGDKDINFLKAIINEMYSRYGIDKNRVYVSGFSMGGMMSYHAANKMGDMIAAIAPVSGGGGVNSPKRAMPIMHTHGTSDDVVNYNSTVNTLKGWVNAQKCSSNSQKIKPYPSTKPGSAASLEIWSGCTDNVEVRLLTIEGKGHWYSMDEAVSVNTSVEIWNFVKNYSLDGSSITPPAPAIVVPTNRDSIFNGGFDSSAVAWDLQLHGDASAVGEAKDGKYQLDISAIGTQNYQVQLIQHDLHLEKGQWYEISFDASAGAARTLEVNVEQHNDPWDSYLTEKQNFEIGTTSKTFTFQFQMTAATDTNSRLSFNAGAATGMLTLDNVKIVKTDAPADTGKTALRGVQFVREQPASYAVFDLRGHRLGTVELQDATEAETLLRAGYTKGVYLLRGLKGEKSFLVPVSR
ncbi:carbohydrate binding domain-containing protein [Fibrobacter sp. UWR2]|uniref:carbohydrate binding domain-containing protein n=1 Tax=Fibrobacter sp. UWR2 TaxID=1964352 RepID=UPI000B51F2FB|nr:carbohydrate binding domain-containing protein [Fibrobacter sp. UWR2]OWV01735.1 carbohydrate-binding protein CenC [Fibrobacter sp. UWR2]